MMKIRALLIILIFLIGVMLISNTSRSVSDGLFAAESSDNHSYKPKDGFVPNEVTAIKIAEAIWLPIYGESIYGKKPFIATLKGDIWIVTGTLPKSFKGGVPIAEISKEDARILRVSHSK